EVIEENAEGVRQYLRLRPLLGQEAQGGGDAVRAFLPAAMLIRRSEGARTLQPVNDLATGELRHQRRADGNEDVAHRIDCLLQGLRPPAPYRLRPSGGEGRPCQKRV